jgi:hypothetical protein
MRQPHPTPHKNRIIPIFGCGCRIRHCQNHCSCKQTLRHPWPTRVQRYRATVSATECPAETRLSQRATRAAPRCDSRGLPAPVHAALHAKIENCKFILKKAESYRQCDKIGRILGDLNEKVWGDIFQCWA